MMKKTAFFLAVLIFLSGCSEKKEVTPSSCDIFAMDTYMNLRIYGDDNQEEILRKASDRITELEKTLSVTDENSDIWKVNHSYGKTVTVSDDTANLISEAVKTGRKTDGALDITIYPVLREWGFTTGEYRIPDADTLSSLLENVDFRKISITGNDITVPENTQADLGSLAKGYTGDEVIKIFRENGVKSAIVNLGGNVQTLGRKPDGSLWKVAVADPFSPDRTLGTAEVSDKAVITSGNYERYFEGGDGETYWHIIDPETGKPARNGLVSVTVIGDEGTVCDELSTALFVMGTEKAIDYRRKNSGFEIILVSDDGKIYISEGIADCFTLSEECSNMKTEVIR